MKSISSILNKDFLKQKINTKFYEEYNNIQSLLKDYNISFDNININKSILFIEVSSSVQRFEINSRKNEIIKLLNDSNININDIKTITSGRRNF